MGSPGSCLHAIFLFKVFGTLRNCCFEAEDQLQNLLLIAEFLWPALLLPVAGNKVIFFRLSDQNETSWNKLKSSKTKIDIFKVRDERNKLEFYYY